MELTGEVMKIIHNEMEYRKMYLDDFRQLSDIDWVTFNPQDIEEEMMEECPLSYPCVAFIISNENSNPLDTKCLYFIYPEQLVQCLLEMQLSTKS